MNTYYYTFSTIKDRGHRMLQTTAQAARNACPVGAALYRVKSNGDFAPIGTRCTPELFQRT